jgi:hypothetical protein
MHFARENFGNDKASKRTAKVRPSLRDEEAQLKSDRRYATKAARISRKNLGKDKISPQGCGANISP